MLMYMPEEPPYHSHVANIAWAKFVLNIAQLGVMSFVLAINMVVEGGHPIELPLTLIAGLYSTVLFVWHWRKGALDPIRS